MIRRVLAASAVIVALLLGGVGVAEAAPLKPLRPAGYTVQHPPGIATGTYRAPARGQWIGAVATPVPAVDSP